MFSNTLPFVVPNLDNLAVELIVDILKGADLQTITSIGLTSSRLYHIVKTDRKLWTDARAILDLPLQTGETLATTPTSSILPLALRAVSVQKHLRDPDAKPHFRLLHMGDYETPAWKLLPGGQWMLFTRNHCIWILNIRAQTTTKTSPPIFVAPRLISRCVFQALGNREMCLIVELVRGWPTGQTEMPRIAVLRLRLPLLQSVDDGDSRPQVTGIKFYTLPFDPVFISLRWPLLLMGCPQMRFLIDPGNELNAVLLNCEADTGVGLAALPPEEEVEALSARCDWMSIHLHPTLEKLVIRCQIFHVGGSSGRRILILLADIPTIRHPLPDDSHLVSLTQSPQSLHFTHKHPEARGSSRMPFPLPSRYVPIMEYMTDSGYRMYSLCLDTHTERRDDEELIAFVVMTETWGTRTFFTNYCAADISPHQRNLERTSDNRISMQFVNSAHTEVSKLRIPIPPEVRQHPPNSDWGEVLETDMNQGQIILTVQNHRTGDAHPSRRRFYSHYLLQY
ncbi:hypothetical protein SISNIDRAFT_458648 [Sistotremastrum niveocremeum HHB9708]|uniref:F-box domain-containing protein n=1 Tax=Sistotremastrum niveocremeum HHB9708 TaxID=1314777 RepID=A0A164Q9J1_9AGAM|nr:hypothetical protein SISNIDRAFT_458648 [Sistotremastrum niveocremeum HHB9708]